MESSDKGDALNCQREEVETDNNLNQNISELTQKCSNFNDIPFVLIEKNDNNNDKATIAGKHADEEASEYPEVENILKKEQIVPSYTNVHPDEIKDNQSCEVEVLWADNLLLTESSEVRCNSVIVDVPQDIFENSPVQTDILPEEDLETKSSFHWICLTRHYKMSPRFKILVSKTTQLLFVFSWALSSKSSDVLIGFVQKYYGMFYIALAFYLFLYLCIRSTNIIRSLPSASVAFTVNSLILAHTCASIFIIWDTYIILVILLTLLFSYFVVCIVCLGFNKIDVKKQDIFVPIVVSTIIYSLISYAVIMLVHDVDNLLEHVGTVWLPSMMISVLVATGEMQEIQKLLYGLRTPLKDTDWIIASNYVL